MKKKIFYFEPNSGQVSGSQKITLSVLKVLMEDDWDVSVFINPNSQFHSTLNELKDIRLYSFVCSRFLKKNVGTGIFDSLNLVGKIILLMKSLFYLVYINFYCVYKCKSQGCKVVYLVDPRGLLLCGVFLKVFNIKVLWHLHGDLNLSDFLKSWLLRLSEIIVVPSTSIKEKIFSYPSVRVVYNGFEFFRSPKNWSLHQGDICKLLYAGSLVPHKGLHNILLGLEGIHDINIDFKIAGQVPTESNNSYLDYLKTIIERLPPSVNVEFLGFVSSMDDVYLKSDCLIMASVINQEIELDYTVHKISSSEALPTNLIEALSLGIPVIASDTPGVKEIVTDESYGIVLEKSDSVLIREAIIDMHSNMPLLFSPYHIRTKFSHDKMKADLIEIFSKI